MGRNQRMIVFCIVLASLAMASMVMATMEEDEKECADQLTNLASCIPFVSGTAKKPTPECCEDTQKVKANKPKCLCVLIKESTDPSMALPINTTLALQMPSACNIDAKVIDCPTILKLPPNSPDAKVFKAAGPDSPTTSTTNSALPGSSTPSSSPKSSSKADLKPPPSVNDGARMKSFDAGNLLVIIVFIACVPI